MPLGGQAPLRVDDEVRGERGGEAMLLTQRSGVEELVVWGRWWCGKRGGGGTYL